MTPDFPAGERVHRGNISIEYLPDGYCPPWKNDHWIIGFHGNFNWDEIEDWIDELESTGEPPTMLSCAFGYAGVILQRRSSVTEAILKYA